MTYRKAKIVCTVGRIPEPDIEKTIGQFIDAGADALRLNMGHFYPNTLEDERYLDKLIDTIRNVSEKKGRAVAIIGDIQGPKVRIKEVIGGSGVSDRVQAKPGGKFVLTSEENLPDKGPGASIRTEGHFDFFQEVRKNVQKDEKGNPKPIEFWFGDGKVILQAAVKDVHPASVTCRVVVGGELKKGQGISVKNSTIRSGTYSLSDHPKDRADIDYLLKKEVDFFALSLVNGADDVKNLHSYIRLRIADLGLQEVEKRFYGIKEFPVISKIETQQGFADLGAIMAVSAGIMVARGDLALQTGIDRVGILQKQIIAECVTAGKPVITATPMLLSMTEFKEPRRSEVTDVTNAIMDGTDALMLSEETADPDSKFPVESIAMMAQIAARTEEELKRRNQIDYRYKTGQQHERIVANLERKRADLESGRKSKRIDGQPYEDRKLALETMGVADHISYDACDNAMELGCTAIVVLTETGTAARLVSRFRPDIPILAGVYCDQIACLVRLNYGVEVFKIDKSRQRERHPFEQYEQTIEQARDKGLLNSGDRVLLVGGYPRPASGTLNFLHVYEVR